MKKKINKINKIINTILNVNNAEECKYGVPDSWDSLKHLELMSTLEKEFNLEFTEGIVNGTNLSKFHTITREDMKRLYLCSNREGDTSGKIFDFNVKPETIFGGGTNSDEDKKIYSNIKSNQQENLIDYIADGQYAMFTVTLIPNRKVPNIDCHDQVGFRFTFAFNLKDVPVLPSYSDCNQNPVFVAEGAVDFSSNAPFIPAHRASTQPKLYDTPMGIRNPRILDTSLGGLIKVDIPGRMQRVIGDNGEYVKKLNITDCLYLGGQRRRFNEEFSHVIAGLDDSDESVIEANEKAGIRIKGQKIYSDWHNGYFLLPFPELQTDFVAGTHVGSLSEVITMITPQLAANACRKTNSKQMSNDDNDLEYNVHFDGASFDTFTDIALDNNSLFGGTAE